MKIYHVFILIVISTLKYNQTLGYLSENKGYCMADSTTGPTISKLKLNNNKYIFYDVNPAEGFNLRRDVYMRMAIFAHNLKKIENYKDVFLVLPPYSNLYHWKSRDAGEQKQIPWNLFFDVASLKSFAPVMEMYEVFEKEKYINFDRVFSLQNYPVAFENGLFEDKWQIEENEECLLMSNFWSYDNITYRNKECVLFQGYSKMLRELIDLYPEDNMVLITNAQIPLHDEYGSKKYWKARMSMKFNSELISIAEDYITDVLNCDKEKCDNYVSVHWRRGDFAKYRSKDVPSIEGTAKQIKNILKKKFHNKIKTVFIATDATVQEINELTGKFSLMDKEIEVKYFKPSALIKQKFKDGGIAIIEQIICSHAAYFVGTHESTFSFRIQEEREILGFESDTTFNRLCPDVGECERPSRWLITR